MGRAYCNIRNIMTMTLHNYTEYHCNISNKIVFVLSDNRYWGRWRSIIKKSGKKEDLCAISGATSANFYLTKSSNPICKYMKTAMFRTLAQCIAKSCIV